VPFKLASTAACLAARGLINDLVAIPAPFVLVLDDYHLIEARPIHEALTFLLDHQPPHMHLILATRADPPLPLARLRARGQLAELRQADLCFTTKRRRLSQQRHGLGCPRACRRLEARTEAGSRLQMAALSLQDGDRTRHPVRVRPSFHGSHRFVLDYLVGEVLEQQPPAIQEFLLKTSILERLTARCVMRW